MASRRCEFRLSMPANHRVYSTGFVPQSTSTLSRASRAPRSPRFHEDFDAPFSEALLNASCTTFASDASHSSQSCHSIDANVRHHSPPISAHNVRRPSRKFSWQTAESSRRSILNDRLRDWAKRSLALGRKSNHAPSDDVVFSYLRRPSFKGPTDEPVISVPGGSISHGKG
ncbi:hypothetical protein XA68_14369 [Ophiocordyceps unilateralis]|uniref:Uncharacterized protein n=1 Tax=Ophiocordyceps unilateralis TaxID=268505 RepID=A0A2A9P931_OPHUN|nr:hypothetical protein XA68_14369 [Ophiocordyceps unilateralis]